jgi:hypothetical protein
MQCAASLKTISKENPAGGKPAWIRAFQTNGWSGKPIFNRKNARIARRILLFMVK